MWCFIISDLPYNTASPEAGPQTELLPCGREFKDYCMFQTTVCAWRSSHS